MGGEIRTTVRALQDICRILLFQRNVANGFRGVGPSGCSPCHPLSLRRLWGAHLLNTQTAPMMQGRKILRKGKGAR